MNLSYLLAFLTTFLLVTGQILWKKGLSSSSDLVLSKFSTYLPLIKSPYIISGLFFYIIATLLWFKVLQSAPISKVYPIMALSYILGMVAGIFIFGEKVALINWLGAGLIMLGVLLATR